MKRIDPKNIESGANFTYIEKRREIETALKEKERQITLLGEEQNQIKKNLLSKWLKQLFIFSFDLIALCQKNYFLALQNNDKFVDEIVIKVSNVSSITYKSAV